MTNVPEPDAAPVGDPDEHAVPLSMPGMTRAERVRSAARGWQHRLSAVGGANTLLWYTDLPLGTLELTTAHPGGLSMLMAGRPTRLSDLVREPSAFVEARRRVVTIRDTATELAQQRGLVTSFLGIGLATWTIRSTSQPPAAAVLLRAVTLRPSDGRLEDFMLDLAPAVELNPVLVHYLRSERGIGFDPEGVAGLAHVDRRFDPGPVFRELSRLAGGLPGFRIDDRRIVSTFPYAKLALVADIAERLTAPLPEHSDSLAQHPVIAALAGDPDAIRVLSGPHGAAGGSMPSVDGDLDPDAELLVVDADAGQQDVVEILRAGRSVVVDAPPGTGVTQTVANIVAAAAADGKSVLVVAQDEAELDDLTARLDTAQLGDLLLRVHEGAHHRRGLVDAVLATLDTPVPTPRGDLTQLRTNLRAHRRTLADHLQGLVSTQAPWGVSVFDVQTALAQLAARPLPPSSRVRLDREVVGRLDRAAVQRLGRTIGELAAAGAWEHGATARPDPWWAARITTEADTVRVREVTMSLSGPRLDADRAVLNSALEQVGLPEPDQLRGYGQDVALLERVRQVRGQFQDDVLRRPLQDLLVATGDRAYRKTQERRLGWWERRALRREAKHLAHQDEPVHDVHAGLQTVRRLREDWADRAGFGLIPAVPDSFEAVCQTWTRLEDDLVWLTQVLGPTGTPGPFLDTSFADLRQRMARLAARAERVDVLPVVLPVIDELVAEGLGPMVEEFAARGVPPQQCEDEVELIWWASVLDQLVEQEETYGRHDGRTLRETGSQYARLDEAHIRSGADQVMFAVQTRRHEAMAAHPHQLAFLRRTGRGGQRLVSTTQMLDTAPDVALAARPVWLMSPFVVAAALPARVCFDLTIVLDAGRLEVPEALGAVLRGRSVAAFGDLRRLGPEPFSVVADAPGGAAHRRQGQDTPLSLLAALGTFLPTKTLRWHHRCTDERLVAFANQRWYGGSLITVPGCARQTPVEILDAPVEEFLERVVHVVRRQQVRRPNESFGVLVVDREAAQRLRLALRDSLANELDALSVAVFEGLERGDGGQGAAFTIRDPWGFQGISRDRVLVVLGPLGSESSGQEGMPSVAALTVALTAARKGLTLMLPSEYREQAASRWDSPAADVVRDFVDSVSPVGPMGPQPGVCAQDALLTELAQRLTHEGLTVHQGYGCGAHELDIAVEDPHRSGAMLVAVDSDGRRALTWRSVRERDRLWPQQLTRAGWDHVRVWGTDVFRDPARDVARIADAVRAAQTRTSWSGRE